MIEFTFTLIQLAKLSLLLGIVLTILLLMEKKMSWLKSVFAWLSENDQPPSLLEQYDKVTYLLRLALDDPDFKEEAIKAYNELIGIEDESY